MNLITLINALNKLHQSNIEYGQSKVYVNCPIANSDCWLDYDNQIEVTTDINGKPTIIIHGGIGA